MQEAGPQVSFAKQGRSHLHQSLELSNTENLEMLLEFNEGGLCGNQSLLLQCSGRKQFEPPALCAALLLGGLSRVLSAVWASPAAWDRPALRSDSSLAQQCNSQGLASAAAGIQAFLNFSPATLPWPWAQPRGPRAGTKSQGFCQPLNYSDTTSTFHTGFPFFSTVKACDGK